MYIIIHYTPDNKGDLMAGLLGADRAAACCSRPGNPLQGDLSRSRNPLQGDLSRSRSTLQGDLSRSRSTLQESRAADCSLPAALPPESSGIYIYIYIHTHTYTHMYR